MKKIMFNDRYGLTAAVLDGSKTMTRRIIDFKDIPEGGVYDDFCGDALFTCPLGDGWCVSVLPKYKVGEVIAIAHGGCAIQSIDGRGVLSIYDVYKSPGLTNKMFVKPEYMPHQIKITAVNVQRLQDISDDDILREGVYPSTIFGGYSYGGLTESWPTAREAFAALIDKVSCRGTWERNPWVFVYSFNIEK